MNDAPDHVAPPAAAPGQGGLPAETTTGMPEGFQAGEHRSPFLDLIGPVGWRHDDATGLLAVGVRVAGRHLNSRGTLHGGVVSALADVALGHATAASTSPPAALATASLNVDFVGPSRAGAWLEVRADSCSTGRAVAFARGVVTADGATVANVSAVFRVLRPARAE